MIRCKISLPASLLPADSSSGSTAGFGWVSLAAKDGSTLLVPEHQWCALPFPLLRVASGSGFESGVFRAPSATDDAAAAWIESDTL